MGTNKQKRKKLKKKVHSKKDTASMSDELADPTQTDDITVTQPEIPGDSTSSKVKTIKFSLTLVANPQWIKKIAKLKNRIKGQKLEYSSKGNKVTISTENFDEYCKIKSFLGEGKVGFHIKGIKHKAF